MKRFLLAVATIAVVIMGMSSNASATGMWAGSDIINVSKTISPRNLSIEKCTTRQVYVYNTPGVPYLDMGPLVSACVYDYDGWSTARIVRTAMQWSNYYYESYTAIGFSGSNIMYRLNGVDWYREGIRGAENSPVAFKLETPPGYGHGQTTKIYKDIFKHLRHEVTSFQFVGEPDLLLTDDGSRPARVDGLGISKNGEWAVASFPHRGIFRIDLESLEVRRISTIAPPYDVGSNPDMHLAITNDGSQVIVGGHSVPFTAIHVTKECGDSDNNDAPLLKMCRQRDLLQPIREKYDAFREVFYFELSDDERYIEASGIAAPTPPATGWVGDSYTLRLGAGNEIQLDYLALGDSYSSGEGDVGRMKSGKSYYMEGTEADGMCHLSSRSYPFLLRDHYDVNPGLMNSVACSGALVTKDYTGNMSTYKGQGERLRNLSEGQRLLRQGEAVDTLVPGEVLQIEFIKRYKPKIVTITGGGNDVGFADVIRYCALPKMISQSGQPVMAVPSTCEYTEESTMLSDLLMGAIDFQYGAISDYVDAIHRASPNTRIVLVGYPKFVGESTGCLNAGSLDKRERQGINIAVERLNSVIEKVAQEKHVSFVDLGETLVGGRLCEGSGFVTGLLDLGLSSVWNGHFQESFHPNARGHQRMAGAIISSNAFEQDMIPEDSTYQPPKKIEKVQQAPIIESGSVVRGQKGSAVLPASSFGSLSIVAGLLHSDPIDLGNFQANEDGSLNIEIDTANFPPGLHLLVLEGTNFAGEPVTYYQFITVKYSSTDEDGDGIPDKVDVCPFIVSWYDEQTNEDVCRVRQAAENESSRSDENYSVSNKTEALGRDTVAPHELQQRAEPVDVNKIDTEEGHTAMLQEKEQLQGDVKTNESQNKYGWFWFSDIVGVIAIGFIYAIRQKTITKRT